MEKLTTNLGSASPYSNWLHLNLFSQLNFVLHISSLLGHGFLYYTCVTSHPQGGAMSNSRWCHHLLPDEFSASDAPGSKSCPSSSYKFRSQFTYTYSEQMFQTISNHAINLTCYYCVVFQCQISLCLYCLTTCSSSHLSNTATNIFLFFKVNTIPLSSIQLYCFSISNRHIHNIIF